MKRRNWLRLLPFLLVFGILGYLREAFFVNLNILMFAKYYTYTPERPLPAIILFFDRFSYAQLYYGKYLLTLGWTAVFFAANLLALRALSAARMLRRILVYSYLSILLIAAAVMLYGYFVNERLASDEYTLSRWLLGVAQSPIICLILLASEKLYTPRQSHDTEGFKDIRPH